MAQSCGEYRGSLGDDVDVERADPGGLVRHSQPLLALLQRLGELVSAPAPRSRDRRRSASARSRPARRRSERRWRKRPSRRRARSATQRKPGVGSDAERSAAPAPSRGRSSAGPRRMSRDRVDATVPHRLSPNASVGGSVPRLLREPAARYEPQDVRLGGPVVEVHLHMERPGHVGEDARENGVGVGALEPGAAEHQLRGRRRQQSQPFVARPQRLFGPLRVRDVDGGARHAIDPSFAVVQRVHDEVVGVFDALVQQPHFRAARLAGQQHVALDRFDRPPRPRSARTGPGRAGR